MEPYKEISLEEPVESDPEFEAIEKLMKEKTDIDTSKCKGRDSNESR
jgi:hypothetical protein